MPIRVTCPNPDCGAGANVEELSLGRQGRCKKCGHIFVLARPGGEVASAISGNASAWKGAGSPRPPVGPVEMPEQFGRYRIMRQLGQGGMGAVYLAQDIRLNRQVALKVPFFHPAEGRQAIERFEREARAAATLDHPNLCPVYDVGEVDGIPYLTMPYLEGKPLSETMPRGQSVTEAQAAALVRKLALALAEAHARGVIHRDLKPGNIIVNRRGEPVIMDFGLARMSGGDAAPLTVSGNVLGTALYMAPEQAAGDVEATGPACDVYSLGVILYELLTGVRPFEGPWSLVIGLKNVQDPDPPSAHRPDIHPALDAICLKAIARHASDRHPSMKMFAADLDGFVADASGPPSDATGSKSASPREDADGIAGGLLASLVGFETTSIPDGQSTPTRVELRDQWLLIGKSIRARPGIAGVVALLLIGLFSMAMRAWPRSTPADPGPLAGAAGEPGTTPNVRPTLPARPGRGSFELETGEARESLAASGADGGPRENPGGVGPETEGFYPAGAIDGSTGSTPEISTTRADLTSRNKPTTPAQPGDIDPIQPGTIWEGKRLFLDSVDPGLTNKVTLTITKRIGEKFEGSLSIATPSRGTGILKKQVFGSLVGNAFKTEESGKKGN